MAHFQSVFCIPLCFLLLSCPAGADVCRGRVVEVIDGDTLRVEDNGKTETVRLLGVDSPELAQSYGPQAKKFTSDLALDNEVTLDARAAEEDGRYPAMVTLADGRVVNREVLAAGFGWFCETDAPSDPELIRLSAKAIVAKVGLWSEPTPLAPWDFRRDAKKALPEPLAEQPPIKLPEVKKEAPELRLKGDHNVAPEQFLSDYKDDPLYKQFQPQWQTDAGGNIIGITAQNLSSNPMAAVLGFQDGDIVQSVNGERIDSEAKILSLVNKLKGARSVQVTILRNGQPQTITIPLPG